MSVLAMDNLKGHRSSPINGIFVAAGRTEATLAPERNKLKLTTGATAIHGTAKRRVTTVKHSVNVFHDSCSGVCSIKDFLIMISDYSL